MIEVSWETLSAMVAVATAVAGFFYVGVRLGIMQGKFIALDGEVSRQGKEIGDLRNKLEQVAPAAALAVFDRRMEVLASKIDEGFMHLNSRIDQLHS